MPHNHRNNQPRTTSQPPAPSFSTDDKTTLQAIFTADPTGEKLVDYAEQVGKKLVGEKLVRDGLSRSQIRNIFSESRKIETSWDSVGEAASLRRLRLLKPKLAYQAAKAPKENQPVLEYFGDVLSEAIDSVSKSADKTKSFNIFMELFEAILAYHRSYGGN